MSILLPTDLASTSSWSFATVSLILPTNSLGTLKHYIREHGGKAENMEEYWTVLTDIIEALYILHSTSKSHSDVKPDNILINRRETGVVAKLTDFGISIDMSKTMLYSHTAERGTELYQPPRYPEKDEEFLSSDIWSTGLVFYEILTGRYPFSGDNINAKLNNKNTKLPDSNFPEFVGDGLKGLVMGMLEREPANRLKCDEVKQRLQLLRRGSEVAIERSVLGKRPREPQEVVEQPP